jgi:hypothetical protein
MLKTGDAWFLPFAPVINWVTDMIGAISAGDSSLRLSNQGCLVLGHVASLPMTHATLSKINALILIRAFDACLVKLFCKFYFYILSSCLILDTINKLIINHMAQSS